MKNQEKMSPESFCFWLQGFFEISNAENLTQNQVSIIKNHLDLVFEKVTPDLSLSEKMEKAKDDPSVAYGMNGAFKRLLEQSKKTGGELYC